MRPRWPYKNICQTHLNGDFKWLELPLYMDKLYSRYWLWITGRFKSLDYKLFENRNNVYLIIIILSELACPLHTVDALKLFIKCSFEWMHEYLNSILNIFVQKGKQINTLDFQPMEGKKEGRKISENPPSTRLFAYIILFPPTTTFWSRNYYPHFVRMEIEDPTASKH